MEVKICGLCRPEDAETAAEAGADYLGVVLAPGGRRSQAVDDAAEIYAAGGETPRVGVFVDPARGDVVDAADALELDVIQLHGSEPVEEIDALRRAGDWRIWKAIRPRSRAEFLQGVEAYADVADGLLVDGWSRRGAGGTGSPFPWREIVAVRDAVPLGTLLVVAGGLTPDNVADAVTRLAPDVVDVSSGVEREVGEKDPERVRAFIDGARNAIAGGG